MCWQCIGPIAQRVAALAAFEYFAVAAHPWRPGDPVGRVRLRGAVEVILDQADRGSVGTLAAGN